MARNRIIYASQSVWVNGEVLYRVQSLGSTTTFTSEDIFELGHLDIVDVVDDVPAVAVTLNTNDFGDVGTLAVLAQLPPAKRAMDATAVDGTANLVVVSGTQLTEIEPFLHGVSLADFAIVCGNLPGVTISAPVQDECSMGTLANNIDQTLFLDEVYVNSLEFGYTTGANATENYGAETDNKMWLLNDARFVNFDNFTLAGAETYVDLTIASGVTIPTLSTGKIAFLRKDDDGSPGATFYDTSANTVANYPVITGNAAVAASFVYDVEVPGVASHRLFLPTDAGAAAAGDVIEVAYAADAYGSDTADTYFTALSTTARPDFMGAIRQGQVEIYIVDPNANYVAPYSGSTDPNWDIAWRLTGCTITADLTREALAELGHLSPYDRPLTLPIPITVTVDTTAGDLENWAKVAGKDYDGNLDDLALANLMKEEDLILVVKVYAQTDEEAGGTGVKRIVATDSSLVGQNYFDNGTMGTYTGSGSEREFALKTIVVEHLKITDEGATLDMGANMTQTFGFRSTNDLFVVKGDITDIRHLTDETKIRRNG